MSTLFGLDQFLRNPTLSRELKGRRVALLAHPASLTPDLTHALDAISSLPDIQLTAAFGPQHGLRGDKQDNMIESPDFFDPHLNIPVFSLYGQTRRPTDAMMDTFDVLLVDLQDLGCRIYTFITTLRYVLEAAAAHQKTVIVLDRPNPVGRPVEGLTLKEGWESFVGAGKIPMRHGLTLGELSRYFVSQYKLDVDSRVVPLHHWQPELPPFGWTLDRPWVPPSPNAPTLNMARAYAGTVMLEGTTLSEGRGTTRPLELFGAPDIDPNRILKTMFELKPEWLAGCKPRVCAFEPMFHKHVGTLCHGIHIHTDFADYNPLRFRPWRLIALAFKAIRANYPDYSLWRNFPYEYEFDRLAIDLINGSDHLRLWVDDPVASPDDLEDAASRDETLWEEERRAFLIY